MLSQISISKSGKKRSLVPLILQIHLLFLTLLGVLWLITSLNSKPKIFDFLFSSKESQDKLKARIIFNKQPSAKDK